MRSKSVPVKDTMPSRPRYWHVYVAFRIVCCLIPQTGYIHPDEFFQTTEVVAGDILDLDVTRPWEFNSTSPLRSIFLPYCVCGPGYLLLRHLSSHQYFTGQLRPPTELLLALPRVTLLAVSLAVDVLLLATAKNLHLNPSTTLWFYATSYVLYVYYNRTFTNTFEAFLFMALLYLCTKRSSRDRGSAEVVYISALLATGIFNRPTFPVFAMVPLCWWMFANGKPRLNVLVSRLMQSVVTTGFCSLFFIVCDTLYYRELTIPELVAEISETNLSVATLPRLFVFTPLNFVLYNSDPSKLATHGTHPLYTHLTVNLLTLFGPGVICLYYRLLTVPPKVLQASSGTKTDFFLLCTVFIPVFMLSIFPHQEARFLIPLLGPASLLCGRLLFGRTSLSWRFLRIEWLIFNVIAALLFGFAHQGGVVRSIAFLQNYINGLNGTSTSPAHSQHHVLYYHTYMPPTHLIGQLRASPVGRRIHIHDLKGAPLESLDSVIELYVKQNSTDIILVTPATLKWKLCQNKHFKLTGLYSAWPHISFEDPPNIEAVLIGSKHCSLRDNYDRGQTTGNILSNLFNLFYLDISYVTV